MANNRSQSRQQSSKMAFCGLLTGLSVVIMLTGGLIPIATYCTPMISGALLLPILLEYGKKTAWTSFAAVSLITLFLGIDKEAAFFYLFLGYYPIAKWDIDRIRRRPLRIAVKLLVFNGAIAAMYAALGFLLHMDAIVQEFTQMGSALLVCFAILLNFCLLLYDRLLIPLTLLYVNRLRPRLKFLRQ